MEIKLKNGSSHPDYLVASGHVLCLRTCAANMTAHGGFTWPTAGDVAAPDWKPRAECGNGLHGLLWGEGDGSLLSWEADARWLVVEVLESEIVNLDGKVKFPRCTVVFCGDRIQATTFLRDHGGEAGERVVTNGEWTSAEKAYAEARRALLDARGDLRMGTEERRRIERTCELARANVEGLCQFAPLEAVGCLSPGHDCAAARKATAARTAAKGRADDDR